MDDNENQLADESTPGEPQQLSDGDVPEDYVIGESTSSEEYIPENYVTEENAPEEEYSPAIEDTETEYLPPEDMPACDEASPEETAEVNYDMPPPDSSAEMSRADRIRAIREAIHQREAEEAAAENSQPSGVADKVAMIRKAIASEEPAYAPPPVRQIPPSEWVEQPEPKKKSGRKKKKKKTLLQSLRGLFPQGADSAMERVRKLIFLGSVAAIIVCGYLVSDYYLDLLRNRTQNNNISDLYHTYEPVVSEKEEPEESDEDTRYYSLMSGAKKLLDINPDVIGYMTIPTKDGDPIVDIPVVQAEDNEKYLTINFKCEESRAGALFLDYRNYFDKIIDHKRAEKDSDHLIVYGHNMGDDSMFGSLKYYERNQGVNYYENHPIIQFNSNYDTYTYKIFAFFILDALDETSTKYDIWNTLNFDSEEDFYDFVNEAKRRTIRTNDVDVKYGDQLLSLSTCNTLLGERGRLIIMARKVRAGEDPYEGTQHSEANTNIKWPTMYYNTRTNEKYDPEAEFVPYGPDHSEKKEAEETNE